MPYHIRKQPHAELYKVYTESGKPLSYRGLPLQTATRQRTAVMMREFGKPRQKQMGR